MHNLSICLKKLINCVDKFKKKIEMMGSLLNFFSFKLISHRTGVIVDSHAEGSDILVVNTANYIRLRPLSFKDSDV